MPVPCYWHRGRPGCGVTPAAPPLVPLINPGALRDRYVAHNRGPAGTGTGRGVGAGRWLGSHSRCLRAFFSLP